MKKIEVTYEAMYLLETGDYEQGETAFVLPMTDELAAEYLAGRATDRGAVNLVETALEAVEVTAHTGVRRRNPGFFLPHQWPLAGQTPGRVLHPHGSPGVRRQGRGEKQHQRMAQGVVRPQHRRTGGRTV